jgi:glycosidase
MKKKQPVLYQVNTRVVLTELAHELQRNTTLDDIPDALLDEWKSMGFEWIWLLSVWQTGLVAQKISRTNSGWRREFEETLVDLQESDIPGSGFAIKDYRVSDTIGGEKALHRFRERLQIRGMRLMLDFVPNHMAPDHPWVEQHPDYFIQGNEELLKHHPDNFMWVKRTHDELILAHGRDPYFPGWPDTLQLNYSNPAVGAAMRTTLLSIASLCDGVRCDMAMLLLPDVFLRTWQLPMDSFWPDAIQEVKSANPGFLFLGEVYWNLEWTMMEQGFDFVYDKRLYDRLLALEAKPVYLHLTADVVFQQKLARFLENHDEQRIASQLHWDIHRAAAIITYFIPGMKFFHEGQLQGWKTKVSPHLGRRPVEHNDPGVEHFYKHLLSIMQENDFSENQWKLLSCRTAWEGNPTHENFIAFQWKSDKQMLLIVVNYAPYRGQCFVPLATEFRSGQTFHLSDLMGDERYDRDCVDLQQKGLYMDIAGWAYHVFKVEQG